MNPARRHERTRQRSRTWVLLAVYALFVLLPGVHVLGHDHGPALPTELAGAATPCCDHGGTHPQHDHVHDDHDCALCDVLASWNVPPVPAAADCTAPAAATPLASVANSTHRACPLARPTARGPPAPFAA